MPLANITVSGQLAAVQTNTPSVQDLGVTTPANFPFSRFIQAALTDGTGAGQADRLFTDQRTISTNDDLDLAGVLVDAMGTTLTFARIKALYIEALAANTNPITIGAGTNPWATFLNAAGTATLRPGGFLVAYAGSDATGWTVTAGTGDILRLSATGSQVYNIGILGCSA